MTTAFKIGDLIRIVDSDYSAKKNLPIRTPLAVDMINRVSGNIRVKHGQRSVWLSKFCVDRGLAELSYADASIVFDFRRGFADGCVFVLRDLSLDDRAALEQIWNINPGAVQYQDSGASFPDEWRTDSRTAPSGWNDDERIRKNPDLNEGRASPGQPETPKQPNKEPHMANGNIKVETITFVDGMDIASLSNGAVLEKIAGQEGAIKRLEAIESKPDCLVKEIADRKAGIKALVEALNARKGKAPADAE